MYLTNCMWQDHFEPRGILQLLQQSIQITQAPLNQQGLADYYWIDIKGNRRQRERKQIIEFLGDMDGVEEQLNRELETCDELRLIIEGIAEPTAFGVQQFERDVTKGGVVRWVPKYHFPDMRKKDIKPRRGLYTEMLGRIEGLKVQGVDVVRTNDWRDTAAVLASDFNSSMKEEHTTFRRYVVPHVPAFSPNPHVVNLAGLKGTGVGVKKAEEAIKVYGSLYGVMTADEVGLNRIWGKATTQKFFEAICRDD